MAKTKKTTESEAEPKKKAAKKTKKQVKVTKTPVDTFIEENEGKLLDAPIEQDVEPKTETEVDVLVCENTNESGDIDIEAIVNSPEILDVEIVEVGDIEQTKEPEEDKSGKHVIGVAINSKATDVKPDAIEYEEITIEADKDSFGEILKKFKEESDKDKVDKTFVAKVGKDAIQINQYNQQSSTNNVHKIPEEKKKRNFLNRVFTAMGLRQD